MTASRHNPRLPDVTLPEQIKITGDLRSVGDAELIVFATPSYAVKEIAGRAAAYLQAGTILVTATKGLDAQNLMRISQTVDQQTGYNGKLAVLSGPTHAEEVSRNLPAGCIVASTNETIANVVQSVFMSPNFRVYTSPDPVGVELCAAAKNIIAIGCGISDGLDLGDNAKALLMTRAVSEISDLVEHAGGERTTCAGLAGIGDIIVTCTSKHSRNRLAGSYIGQGMKPEAAMKQVGAVVEGYYAVEGICKLADQCRVTMPICSCIYQILYHGQEPKAAMKALMMREKKPEYTAVTSGK